jgi:peptidoglycan-N-acetylglucosamine deacetylase
MHLDELIRGPSRPTPTELRHRQRRIGALVALAVLSLLMGVIAGAGGGGDASARHPHTPAIGWYGRLRLLAGSGARSLSVEEQARESAAIDRTLASTPFVRLAGTQHRLIALTFDDGPSPYTDALLAELQRLHVPATFFVVGYQLPDFAPQLQHEIAGGTPIGDHTEDHANLAHLTAADQRQQVVDDAQKIVSYGGRYPRLFRPPYGSYNQTTHAVLHRLRMLSVLWSIDSEDYTKPGAAAIVRNVVSKVRPGSIVLMHDGGGDRSETVAALAPIVRALRRRGYRFVTVPRLLLENPPPAQQELPAGFNPTGAG